MNDGHHEISQPCESYGPGISALIDGELEAPDVLAAVDHLVECPHCRSFYRRARRLGEMVTSAGVESNEAPPEEIWRRIASRSGIDGAAPRRQVAADFSSAFRRWAPRLAALLLIGLGLLMVRYLPRPAQPVAEDQVVVTLEEDSGTMTDERFVSLATEVLRADRRYHRKMLQVMWVAAAAEVPPEGTVDGIDERPWQIEEAGERISLGEDDHLGDREGFVWRGQQL